MIGIVFVTARVPTTDIDEIPLQYNIEWFCVAALFGCLKTNRNLKLASKCDTSESETNNKIAKTLK